MLDTMGLFWSDLTLCNIGKYVIFPSWEVDTSYYETIFFDFPRSLQGCSWNPAEHPRWCYFTKLFNGF